MKNTKLSMKVPPITIVTKISPKETRKTATRSSTVTTTSTLPKAPQQLIPFEFIKCEYIEAGEGPNRKLNNQLFTVLMIFNKQFE